MTTYLLDVNLLLALTDPMHIHHESAHRWFAEKGSASLGNLPAYRKWIDTGFNTCIPYLGPIDLVSSGVQWYLQLGAA